MPKTGGVLNCRHHRRVLVGLLALSQCCIARADVPFTHETVLHDFMWNSPTSTAIDSRGNVHTAFMTQVGTDSATKEIWYAHRDSSTGRWSFQQITSNTVREEFPCIALDAQENVHIAFHTGVTGGTNKIRYVNNVGAPQGQFNPIVDITGNGYSITRVVVDPGGTAHFAFRTHVSGSSTQEIIYTTYTPEQGVGTLTNVSNTPTADDYGAQIALDPDGHIHIVWQRGSPLGGPLGYVKNVGGSFVMQATGVAGNVSDPHILISQSGDITILYRPNLDSMMYIENSGSGFSSPLPVYTGAYRAAFMERPAIDQNGLRYVAFASNIAANHGTFFVRETKDGWDPPQLLADGNNQGASVALNAAGTLVVTYQLSAVNQGQVYADILMASTELAPACEGDIAPPGGDGSVTVDDLLEVINSWGSCSGCPADLDNNGLVNVDDLLRVINHWGSCP